MLQDVGEHIPYAKKETYQPKKVAKGSKADKPVAVTLKSVWPEPDWCALYQDGVSAEVLAGVYGIYIALPKKPHTLQTLFFKGQRITVQMWEKAYIQGVTFIREACENAPTTLSLDLIKNAFKEHFSNTGQQGVYLYAVSVRSGKSFLYPFNRWGRPGELKKVLPLLDWPMSVDAKKVKLLPIELQDRRTKQTEFVLGRYNNKSVAWSSSQTHGYKNSFNTFLEAVDALIRYHGEEFRLDNTEDNAPDLYTPKKQPSDMISIEGEYPTRTPEELLNRYGFRGIQFGNYLPQKERQAYVTNTYHSIELLIQILCMPAQWLGGGELGLAFGARGNGFAAAHYELELHVINLTRFNGAGCIAHEVFHALDARLAREWAGRTGLLSNFVAANAVSTKGVKPEYHQRFEAFCEFVRACTQPSSFTANAYSLESQKGAAKYWTKTSELCARAFEALVQDVLEQNGITKQWLAVGTRESDYPLNGMHPYPTGSDRTRINVRLSQLIPIIFGKY